jgi:hypothetical protein
MTAASVPGLVTFAGLFSQSFCGTMKRMSSMPQSLRSRGSLKPSPGPQSIQATPFSGVAFFGRSSGRLTTIV